MAYPNNQSAQQSLDHKDSTGPDIGPDAVSSNSKQPAAPDADTISAHNFAPAINKEHTEAEVQHHYGSRNESYDDDNWGVPPGKLTSSQLQFMREEQRRLSFQAFNLIRLSQCLIVIVFGAAFFGWYKSYALLSRVIAPSELPPEVIEQLSPLWHWGLVGEACWYAFAALAGGLSLIVPLMVFKYMSRSSNARANSAAGSVYDLIRAEFFKYALMILCLGAVFKFTELSAATVICSFVILMCFQIYRSMIVMSLMSRGGRRSFLDERTEQTGAHTHADIEITTDKEERAGSKDRAGAEGAEQSKTHTIAAQTAAKAAETAETEAARESKER